MAAVPDQEAIAIRDAFVHLENLIKAAITTHAPRGGKLVLANVVGAHHLADHFHKKNGGNPIPESGGSKGDPD